MNQVEANLTRYKTEYSMLSSKRSKADFNAKHSHIVMEALSSGMTIDQVSDILNPYVVAACRYMNGHDDSISSSYLKQVRAVKRYSAVRAAFDRAHRDPLHDFLHHPSVSMDRPSIDDWALSMCKEAAKRSTCVRRKAGAIALDEHNRVVSVGYNGVPRGIPHCTQEHYCPGASDPPGQTSNCMAIHAEINCIMHAKDSYRIHKMYVTCTPCMKCGLVLANLPNLTSVICSEKYSDERGILVLNAAGIDVKVIHDEEVDK